MTEETTTPIEEVTVDEPQAERSTSETAFIIVKEWDGGWRVVTDLSSTFTVARDADRADVKFGTGELSRFIERDEMSNMVVAKLSQGNKPESQATADSMRQALQDRNLM
jgi:hypothetical protein